MADVAMPRLSDSMEEGTILKWLKSEGDEVKRGDELVEIETDKANMTYEADQDGTLQIVAQEGDTLPVGETIARIGEGAAGEGGGGESEPAQATEQESQASGSEREPGRGAEDAAESAESEQEAETAPEPATATAEAEPEPAPTPAGTNGHSDGGRVKASPIARRMAQEMGLELSGVQGTGPGGRIVKADVEAAAKGDGARAGTAAPAEAP